MKSIIPAELRREHENLCANLDAAKKEPAGLGEAARELCRVMRPHIAMEEELVFPLLGLLPRLVEGKIGTETADALVLRQRLREALPGMLADHRRIQALLDRFRAAAAAASRPAYERFADALMDHIEAEEEVLYLAAILVGDHIALKVEHERAKSGTKTNPPWRTRLI